MSSRGLDFVINHPLPAFFFFFEHLLSNYCVPGAVIDAGDAAENKTGKKICPQGP